MLSLAHKFFFSAPNLLLIDVFHSYELAETHRIHSLVEYFPKNKEKDDVFYERMHSPTEYFLTKQGKKSEKKTLSSVSLPAHFFLSRATGWPAPMECLPP